MTEQIQLPNFSHAADEIQKRLDTGRDFKEVVKEKTDELALELVNVARSVGNAVGEERERQHRQIREVWGEALELFMSILVTAKAMTEWDVHRRSAAERNEPRLVVIFGIMARLLRVGFEVHELCLGGFGKAALARSRTAHELATYATLIGEDGTHRRPSYQLAERYIAYGYVQRYKDAVAYNHEKHRPAGREPFSQDEMAEFKGDHDRVVREFGPPITKPNGWAAPLFSAKHRIQFPDLEKKAGAESMRSHYRWANHEVHADSWGAVLNQYEANSQLYLSTGRAVRGLGDPLSATTAALHKGVVSVMLSTQENPTISSVLVPMTIAKSLALLNEVTLVAETNAATMHVA